jgi:predicted transcriptional regulator
MTMAGTTSLSFRVSDETAERLDALAVATDRPRSWLLEQALDSYLEVQAWQVEHIRQGLAELDAGLGIPHEEVVERFASLRGARKKRSRK